MEMISTPILAQEKIKNSEISKLLKISSVFIKNKITLQMKSQSTIMLDFKEQLLDGNATR